MRKLRILITFLLLSINLYPSLLKIEIKKDVHKRVFVHSFHKKTSNTFNEKKDSETLESNTSALKKSNKIALRKELVPNYKEQPFTDKNKSSNLSDSTPKTINKNSVSEKYTPGVNIWSFIYLYVSLIGFYITIVIHFNKQIDSIAKKLISAFLFTHSIFIIHIFLFLSNYQFNLPHSYLISTGFSFLYGPLLYFYFKRITEKYVFKPKDLIHLLPTLLMFIYLTPKYLLPASVKLKILISEASGYTSENSSEFITIMTLKIISLFLYGIFIRKIFLKSQENTNLSNQNKQWKKNIYRIHFLYLICYFFYGFLSLYNINSGLFFNMQIFAMAIMILYIGYSANAQPAAFSGSINTNSNQQLKYQKSGLTDNFSNELKDSLIRLFDIDKIYRENQINLELLAKKLDTTKHNTSQVINEHFKMNFHELVNWYRIKEAKDILDKDVAKNLNIIDIAYEVGYNNKVTFNKAFKKETSQTPKQYQKQIRSKN
ncbi:helix-turn-helix domain-containing protein [uncultured Maribacter sp.]|uniref:helix-turn-helix domain-containing protein n=1 Tax=uncultured Maribacter sp. TaxID=431308 RepID=UPI002629E69A|nr:helix-turn-helix domain-containing protein [uncultured Maribacter sp.]